MSKVVVAVRSRPLNRREIQLGSPCTVHMEGHKTILLPHGPAGATSAERTFTYDHSFWSTIREDAHYADQELVFSKIGAGALDNAFQGYNACIFAYGQTGSGKSYTMMGPDDDKGLIPRLCDSMFAQIEANSDEHLKFKVEVSYMEIYNEKVHDLLGDMRGKKSLKVREHKILGPYVEGLTKLAVKDFSTIAALIDEGNKSRTVAATNMNAESSRSHAVFNIILTQSQFDPVSKHTGEKVSKISLVDLAGSERISKTGAEGDRRKEASNINKSLTTLGLVISALADMAKAQAAGKKKTFVPYRDSTLTWLLKDNLGGNSKTIMVATISPAADNYDETVSTLRYADRAKRIVNHAVVNEDPNARLIRELREEVDRLKSLLGLGGAAVTNAEELAALRAQLAENEELMSDMTMSWEEKLAKAEKAFKERQRQLEEMGVSVVKEGLAVDKSKSYLVNLNADPSMNELLVYYLKDVTRVGSGDDQDIILSGLGIEPAHAVITNENDELFMEPIKDATICVNGKKISERVPLRHGFRVLWGSSHLFRVNCPRLGGGNEENASSADAGTEWDLAQQELADFMKTDDVWEQEKQTALELQRQEYEKQIAELLASGRADESGALIARQEAERDLEKMRQDLVSITREVREANELAKAIGNRLRFVPCMRISVQGLSDPRVVGSAARELAVTTQHLDAKKSKLVRSLEDFREHLDFLRDIYQRSREGEFSSASAIPAYYKAGGTELIGVARTYLTTLRHGIFAELQSTIVNQDGKIRGQLTLCIATEDREKMVRASESSIASAVANSSAAQSAAHMSRGSSSASLGSSSGNSANNLVLGDTLRISIKVLQATGLPSHLATFVYCRFGFFNCPTVHIPELTTGGSVGGVLVEFDPTQDTIFDVEVTEELLNYLRHGCLAVEVWGHNMQEQSEAATGAPIQRHSDVQPTDDWGKHRTFGERWADVSHELSLWTEVCEVDDEGHYGPVPLLERKDVATGGILQIRQGYARRLVITISHLKGSALGLTKISAVRFGEIWMRDKSESEGLCSASEADLEVIKEKFSQMLLERKATLDEKLHDQVDTSEDRSEEMAKLMQQWNELQEERDAMLKPMVDSGIPGAARTEPLGAGYERLPSVIFFPLDEDSKGLPMEAVGVSHGWEDASANFMKLHIVSQSIEPNGDLKAVVSWDAAAHDNSNLLRVTKDQHRIFMRLQVVVGVQTSNMELVLNKLLCFKVFKRNQNFKSAFRNFFHSAPDITGCGLRVQVITGLPASGEEDEEAQAHADEMAAAEYQRSVASMDNVVHSDKLRQELILHESQNSSHKTTLNSPRIGLSQMFSKSDWCDRELERVQSLIQQAEMADDMLQVELLTSRLNALQRVAKPMLASGGDEWVVVDDSGQSRSQFVSPMKSPTRTIAQSLREASPTEENPSPAHFRIFKQRIETASTQEEMNEVYAQAERAHEEGELSEMHLAQLEHLVLNMVGKQPTSQLSEALEALDEQTETENEHEAETTPAVSSESISKTSVVEQEPASPTAPKPEPEAKLLQSAPQKAEEEAEDANATILAPEPDPVSEAADANDANDAGDDGDVTSPLPDADPSVPDLAAEEPPFDAEENDGEDDNDATSASEAGDDDDDQGDTDSIAESATSEASSTATPERAAKKSPKKTCPFRMNQRVVVGSKAGRVRFFGRTEFADGYWLGVELEVAKGKNDGSVDGVRYFSCKPKHGTFVRASKAAPLRESSRRS
eukprot:m.64241 g.64241  ORF g.64241 m.64241 type:complete len:1733 (-) comp7505_c0_seq1:232-5430(-)